MSQQMRAACAIVAEGQEEAGDIEEAAAGAFTDGDAAMESAVPL